MEIPISFSKDLKRIINSFIWSSKKKEIDERSITITQINRMCQTPEKGGAIFLDLDSQIAAFATRWIQRLLDPSKAFWKDFVWYKIEEAIGEHPIAELPREQIFIADIPTKLKKNLSNITGIWKLAFKTYFNIPFKSTPLQDLSIHDLKSTSIYYNKEFHINNKVIEPKLIPIMATIDDIWDEEDNCILSRNKLECIFLSIQKKKLNAFHKILRTLEPKIKQLIDNASTTFPLPLIARRGKKHYLITQTTKSMVALWNHIQKPSQKTYKLNKTPVEEITNNSKLYHCYITYNKVFGYQHHRTYKIEHFNFDNELCASSHKLRAGLTTGF